MNQCHAVQPDARQISECSVCAAVVVMCMYVSVFVFWCVCLCVGVGVFCGCIGTRTCWPIELQLSRTLTTLT
jgi:hypothetical protein